MPLVSLVFVARQWRALRAAPKAVSAGGLWATAAGLALHAAAFRAQQPRLSAMALVGLTWTIPWAVWGPAVARRLLFPCGYLLLAVGSYALINFTFPLRLFASRAAVAVLNGLNIAAERSGTAIYSAAGGGFHFDVADPCSGLRSLVVITALAAPYAYLTQRTTLRRWLLFGASLPLAMACNVLRIVTIALVAQAFGREQALRVYHDGSGFIIFASACLLLVGADRLLNLPYRRLLSSWNGPAGAPTSES